jgi:anti-anti-sigma factor
MADPDRRDMEVKLVSRDGGVIHLLAAGRIVHATLAPSPDPIGDLLGREGFAAQVLLSLEGVSFVDSSGIGWLLGCRKRFREAGGRLVIHSVPIQVLDIIKVMRLGHVLQLADNEATALAMIQGDAP